MNDQSIRERLLNMEERTPALEERFKKEIKRMLERKLTRFEKIAWALASVVGAFFVIFFSYLALVTRGLPWLARVGFIEGAVFGAAWVALGMWILKKGSFNWFQHENAVHGITFGFVLLLLVSLLLLGGQLEDEVKGIKMMLSGAIFFMIFGIPALFNMRISRTEASLREQLLRIQLNMAELTEKTEDKR